MEIRGLQRLLSPSELACLKSVSLHGDSLPFSNYGSDLLRLIELGFIEKVVQVWIPLEMKHDRYKLTQAGHQAISRFEHSG